MDTLLLIRHGQTDWNQQRRVMGHLPTALNRTGVAQAKAAAAALQNIRLAAVYSSPLKRAEETARMISAPHGLEPLPAKALVELPFGAWTGKYWEELRALPLYQQWRADPSSVTLPGGVSLAEVQHGAVEEIERLRTAHPKQIIAVVSHADVIKSVLCHYLGLDLKFLFRLLIDNGSTSRLVWSDEGVKVSLVNAGPPPALLGTRG